MAYLFKICFLKNSEFSLMSTFKRVNAVVVKGVPCIDFGDFLEKGKSNLTTK